MSDTRLSGVEKLKKKNWNPKTQKTILKLTVRDVLYWENPYFSIGIVLTLNILYLLVSHYDYTILSLVAMLFSVNIFCFFLYKVILSLTGKKGWELNKVELTMEHVETLVEQAVEFFNKCASRYVDLARADNYKRSLLACFILFLVSRIFSYFEDLTLILLFVNGALVVPFFLDTFEVEVEKMIEKAKKGQKDLVSRVRKAKKSAQPHVDLAMKKGKKAMETAKVKGTELLEKGKVRGAELLEKGKVRGAELYEKGTEIYEIGKGKGAELLEKGKEKGEVLLEMGKEKGSELLEKGEVLLEMGKEKGSELLEKGKEMVDEYRGDGN